MYQMIQKLMALVLATMVVFAMSAATPAFAADGIKKEQYEAAAAEAVTTVSAKATGYNKIRISWQDYSVENDGYEIYRYSSQAGSYKQVKKVSDWHTAWTDKSVKLGQRYHYKVRAFGTSYDEDEEGNITEVFTRSAFSKSVSAATSLGPPKLKGKAVSSSKVKLRWTRVSGAKGYKIFKYKPAKKKYVTVKTVKSGKTATWADKKLKANQKNKYKVKAFAKVSGKVHYSKYSNVKVLKTKKAPKAPKPKSNIVYITKTGAKYHRGSCHYLSRSKIRITRSAAKARGYTPCSICKP